MIRHFLFWLMLCGSVSAADLIQLGLEGEEGEVPIPSGIVQGRDGSSFTYTVSSIYGKFAKDQRESAETSALFYLQDSGFPEATAASFDLTNRTFRLVTKKPIPGHLLRDFVDFIARNYGDLPYWSELQARELPKAPDFSARNFQLKRLKRELPEGLAWFGVGNEPLRLPIGIDLFRRGTLLISRTTAYCMCHDCLAIRILDEKGRLFWQTEDFAQGSVSFALTGPEDERGAGTHDVIISVDDHGWRGARYRLTRNFEEEAKPSGKTVEPAPEKPVRRQPKRR
jgi:hypothetical protein